MNFKINIYNDQWDWVARKTIQADTLDEADTAAQRAVEAYAKSKQDRPQYYSWDFGLTERTIGRHSITLLSGRYYVMTRTIPAAGEASQVTIRQTGSQESVWEEAMPVKEANALMIAFDLEKEDGVTMRLW